MLLFFGFNFYRKDWSTQTKENNSWSNQPTFLTRRLNSLIFFTKELATIIRWLRSKVVNFAPNKVQNNLSFIVKICKCLIREFKKLRRQLQQKRHIKIELCVKLSLWRLFHVNSVAQNRRTALSLAWYKWFSCKGKGWKIYCWGLALSSEPQIWKFHIVAWQTTSKHCTKKRAARAARLFFFIQPIESLICGVFVDVAVVKS